MKKTLDEILEKNHRDRDYNYKDVKQSMIDFKDQEVSELQLEIHRLKTILQVAKNTIKIKYDPDSWVEYQSSSEMRLINDVLNEK